MSLGKLIKIAKQGFALPVLSLLNSIFIYVLMQLANIPRNLPAGSKFEIPGYATDIALFGIIISLMTIGGYFKNFTNGVEYPKRAFIYGVCALSGLIFFWNAVGGVSQGGIG